MTDRDDDERTRRAEYDAASVDRTRPGSHVTIDDLSPLEVQVRALREDLSSYRGTLEAALRRRLWALGGVVAALVASLLVVAVGSAAMLSTETERARVTLETARLEACTTARTVQTQVAAILLESPRFDREALAVLTQDPCAVDHRR